MEFKIENHEQDWHFIREQVFVQEQGFQNEFDDIDDIALHVCLYDQGKLIGCGRIYPNKEDESIYMLGRLAVLKAYRKGGYGHIIVTKLEELAKAKGAIKMRLSAQCNAQVFYERGGYCCYGEVYMDEHCPHIAMQKKLI